MPRQLNAAAVKSIRQLVGISGRELARRCDLSEGAMTRIERGLHNVTPETARKIADKLGVPLDAITTVVPEREPEAGAA